MSLRRKYDDLLDRYNARVAADEAETEATATEDYALSHLSAELDRCKETVALHIVAAGHPSTVVHDVKAFAESLREALAANGVDLRLELARLEGSQL
ncbi:hypothetical protein [Streptomyces sp. NPDC001492]